MEMSVMPETTQQVQVGTSRMPQAAPPIPVLPRMDRRPTDPEGCAAMARSKRASSVKKVSGADSAMTFRTASIVNAQTCAEITGWTQANNVTHQEPLVVTVSPALRTATASAPSVVMGCVTDPLGKVKPPVLRIARPPVVTGSATQPLARTSPVQKIAPTHKSIVVCRTTDVRVKDSTRAKDLTAAVVLTEPDAYRQPGCGFAGYRFPGSPVSVFDSCEKTHGFRATVLRLAFARSG